jgi:hypothetical protein
MKKIFAILLAVMLIASVTVPAYAVTPPLNVPDIEIPDISDNVEIELPDGVFDDYIPDLTPKEPTEPPVEEPEYNWCDWVKGWFEWWKVIMEKHWHFPIR